MSVVVSPEKRRAWTRGPWFMGNTPGYLAMGQGKDGRARHHDPITIRSNAHTEEIATVWTYLLPTKSNALLIAAAPDMYEYIEYVSAQLDASKLPLRFDAWLPEFRAANNADAQFSPQEEKP